MSGHNGAVITSNTVYTDYIYRIQPNYHTVRLVFSKVLGKLLMVKYACTFTKGLLKKSVRKALII